MTEELKSCPIVFNHFYLQFIIVIPQETTPTLKNLFVWQNLVTIIEYVLF